MLQGAGQAQGRVLVVDDEVGVRTVAARMLEYLGYSTVEAGDGSEALELFREEQGFALVLLDLTMPRMDGEVAFRELRRLRADVPVIVSSGYHAQEVRTRFAGEAMVGFIQKPYSLDGLRGTLKQLLG